MGYRIYGEPESPESPWVEFFIGFLLGAIGFPMQIGWVFIWLGWLDLWVVLATGCAIGLALGFSFGRSSSRRKKTKRPS